MEGPASVTCLRTCYRKDCKPLHLAENPSEPGRAHLSRSSACPRRTVRHRRSNSISMCTLPIIPEYPGFQDTQVSRNYLETPAFNRIFQDLERGKSSSPQLNNFPNRASLVHCLGGSSRGFLKGHPTTSSGFHDKPLQEYFNERLLELRNYESKRSNWQTKGLADKNQNSVLTHRLPRRRSSCSTGVMTGHSKESEESCSSANLDNAKAINQEEPPKVLDFYKDDLLDILTMHISAPLEAFVQKKMMLELVTASRAVLTTRKNCSCPAPF